MTSTVTVPAPAAVSNKETERLRKVQKKLRRFVKDLKPKQRQCLDKWLAGGITGPDSLSLENFVSKCSKDARTASALRL